MLAAVLVCARAEAAVEFKFVTQDGFVAFAAADDWPVLSMQSKPPVLSAVFQIPNAADAGTPDSTNLSIQFFEFGSPVAQEQKSRVGRPIGESSPTRDAFEGWTLYRQEAEQGSTKYSIVDATREVAGFSVAVRLAWPHLEKNPGDYPQQMDSLLRGFLRSVRQHVGPYEPRPGEVIRRPSP